MLIYVIILNIIYDIQIFYMYFCLMHTLKYHNTFSESWLWKNAWKKEEGGGGAFLEGDSLLVFLLC